VTDEEDPRALSIWEPSRGTPSEELLAFLPPEVRAEIRLAGEASGLVLVLRTNGPDARLEVLRLRASPPQLDELLEGGLEVIAEVPVRRRRSRTVPLPPLRRLAEALALPLAEFPDFDATLEAPGWIVPPGAPRRDLVFPPSHPNARCVATPTRGRR